MNMQRKPSVSNLIEKLDAYNEIFTLIYKYNNRDEDLHASQFTTFESLDKFLHDEVEGNPRFFNMNIIAAEMPRQISITIFDKSETNSVKYHHFSNLMDAINTYLYKDNAFDSWEAKRK